MVLLTAAALVVTPLVVAARPASVTEVGAAELTRRITGSATVAWSGSVETVGGLQVPESASFATLGELLGETSQLRVWWRAADDWRVDRIRSTGETDLFRQGSYLIRWVFESETATISPVSRIRLPDASDLVPPTLARSLLQGARAEELSVLPARRVAGVAATGVRLTPDEAAATISQVDVWADPRTGVALRVEVFGTGEERPVLTSALLDVDLATPAPSTTDFSPAASTKVSYEESVDIAAAANALAPYDLPVSLGGLTSRRGEDPGAVGIYGRGATTLIVLPLRGQVARPLREQLAASAQGRETTVGTLAPAGPIGLLVTPPGYGEQGRGAFLLAGTVTAETLERVATELLETQ